MNVSHKCSCCEHESVCKFVSDYEESKRKVLDVVEDACYKRIIEVSIKCANFKAKNVSFVRGEM